MDITYEQAKQRLQPQQLSGAERREPCAIGSFPATHPSQTAQRPSHPERPQTPQDADTSGQTDASDEAIMLQQIRSGDQKSFQQMYRHYAPLIFKRLLRLVGTRQQAEECLQQVFVEVVDNMHTYRGDGAWHAWLNKITTNVVLQHFRRARRQTSLLQSFGIFWRHKYKHHEGDAIPEACFVQEERKQLVHEALDQLDPRKRIVILLCDLEGIALTDVAQELDIPKGTVASRLHHGRQELRYLITEALRRQGISAKDWIHD